MKWWRRWWRNWVARRRLGTSLFNHPANDELDDLFWAVAHSTITDIRPDLTGSHLLFTALGLEFEVWDANRWYAWLCSGTVKRNGAVVMSWREQRPSEYVMWTFKCALEKAHAERRPRVKDLLYEAVVESTDGDPA